MNNLPRQMLRRIVAKYGSDVGSDAKRCEGLLNDLCGSYRREINVLVNAIEERVPSDLLAAGAAPRELVLARLEKRLEEQLGMTAEASRWAVGSWALALGATNDAEIERRERIQSEQPRSPRIESGETIDDAQKIESSSVNRPIPVQPPPKPRTNNNPQPPNNNYPPKPSTTFPPVVRQPTAPAAPIPAAPSNRTHTNQQIQPPIQQQPPADPNRVPKRRFGIFRGCLIALLLLAATVGALFFGVPYAIEVMRETQRERNSEPPRFPVR